jgi:hypothetical protein
MDISTSEYEQKRHVFEHCDWINGKLAEMYKSDDFETIYFERNGLHVKRLIEEAMPLACLGLYFFKPWKNVYLQCLTGNQPYDGVLSVIDHRRVEFKVEVTTVENDESTMRRQALARDGHVFMTGEIRREGRKIVTQAEMVDMNVEYKRWINLAFARYLKKVGRGYDEDTAILVSFGDFGHIPFSYRAELMKMTEKHIRSEKPQIYGAYYCYWDDFVVDGIKVTRR